MGYNHKTYRKWYKKNQERIKVLKLQYYYDNKERILEQRKIKRLQKSSYDKEYYRKNRKKILNRQKEYYQKNKQRIKERRCLIYE